MKRVIGWFVSNPVAANLLMTILIAGGLISIFQIRQEEMPPIDLDMVTVNVPYLGAAPEEVENGVNLRIEEALEGVQGIYRMTSTSSEGGGSVLLELETNANRIQTANEIKSQIDAISTFPVETERPVVSLLTMINDGLEIAINGDADERTLKELALEVRDEIAALEGVSSVEVAYVRPDEISIEVSEQTLRRMGLTFDQVANAVRRTSLDMPGGSIRSGAGEILLRTQGQAYTGEDFRDIVVVSREDGTRVYLDEIATIVDGFQEGETQARFDGKPAAIVRVNQVGDEDVVEISETVRTYVGRSPRAHAGRDRNDDLAGRVRNAAGAHRHLAGIGRHRPGAGVAVADTAAGVPVGHVGRGRDPHRHAGHHRGLRRSRHHHQHLVGGRLHTRAGHCRGRRHRRGRARLRS